MPAIVRTFDTADAYGLPVKLTLDSFGDVDLAFGGRAAAFPILIPEGIETTAESEQVTKEGRAALVALHAALGELLILDAIPDA